MLRPTECTCSVSARRPCMQCVGRKALLHDGRQEQAMKVGMRTGGGDCPGLNAVIRAIVRKGSFHYEDEFVGFLEGWRGLLEDKSMPLDLSSVGGILPRGVTILRTSRTNPANHPGGIDQCTDSLNKYRDEAHIETGDDDTLSVAQRLVDIGV